MTILFGAVRLLESLYGHGSESRVLVTSSQTVSTQTVTKIPQICPTTKDGEKTTDHCKGKSTKDGNRGGGDFTRREQLSCVWKGRDPLWSLLIRTGGGFYIRTRNSSLKKKVKKPNLFTRKPSTISDWKLSEDSPTEDQLGPLYKVIDRREE